MQRPCVNPHRADQTTAERRSRRPHNALTRTATRPRWVLTVLPAVLSAVGALALTACSSPPAKPSSPAQAQWEAQSQAAARALRRGDGASALASYQAALATAEAVEDFESAAISLLNLAAVQGQAGQTQAAMARVDRILGQPAHFSAAAQAQAAARKALLHADLGQPAQALQWADRSQALCPDTCGLAPVLNNLRAHVALSQGELDRAAILAAKAVEQAAAAGLQAEQANGLRLAGRAHSQQGQHERAAQQLAQALLLDQTLGLPERISLDLQYAAENEVQRGQTGAARAYLERALVVSQAAGQSARVLALRQQLQSLVSPAAGTATR